MRKIISTLILILAVCSTVNGQVDRKMIGERRVSAHQASLDVNKKAGKLAVKQARSLKKAGWKVSPGQVPLEQQLDKLFKMYYEYDSNGLPIYIFGESRSTSKIYDAAKMQAINNAKVELAGMIETEITSLTESSVSNYILSAQDAEFINSAVRTSKTLIVQKLGRTVTVLECFRTTDNNLTEVHITLAYNIRKAFETAGEVLKEQLASEGRDMNEQVDRMWNSL